MRLCDAHVERFGTWHDLSLPADSDISVFYGPNEAGKTTLMRFLRGMLYGFADDVEANAGGSLGIRAADRELRLERRTRRGLAEQVAVTGENRIGPVDESLRELLCGVSAEVFNNVFAIGLPELQELGTLNGDEIADAIYGDSLAPAGRRLLRAIERARQHRDELYDAGNGRGQLAELLELDRELGAEIRDLAGQRDEYERLSARRETLAADVADMRSRKAGMHSQLRGHRFMEHVWGPWRQVQEYQEALARIPDASRFPRNGLQQLAKWNEQISSTSRCRNALKEEVKQLKSRAGNLRIDAAALRNATGIRTLSAQKNRIERTLAEHRECAATVAELKQQHAQAIDELGDEWTTERLEAVDTSADAQFRILDSARRYQAAIVQRGRLRRLYKRLSDADRKLRKKTQANAEKLGGLEPQAALAALKRQAAVADEFEKLDRQRDEMTHRVDVINKELSLIAPRETMPRWFFWVLVFFAVSGGLVCAAGIVSGFTSNALAGAVLALVGLTGVGVAWGLRVQSRGAARDERERLTGELRTAKRLLAEARQSREELQEDLEEAGEPPELAAGENRTEQLARHIAALKAAIAAEKRQQRRRRRLVELRGRIPRRQQAVAEARLKWCESLRQAGLPEDVKIDESFALWQKVCVAIERQREWQAAREKLDLLKHDYEHDRNEICALGKELSDTVSGDANLCGMIDRWQHRLEQAVAARDERRKLIREIRARRKEAARYSRQLARLQQKRQALLAQAGADDEEEFEQLAGSLRKRAELEELLELADEELREAAATEPELAVVEEDLRDFDSAQNAECIHALEVEIGEIESDLQTAHEELGRVKQALEILADDRRATKLKYEQARVRESIRQTVNDWLGVQLAGRGFDAVRERFERSQQPRVLSAASEYFQRLTRGQYRNLWTPLGRRVLCVDDEQGNTRQIEQLSGGTREQLFLAVRLAAVDHFREQGVELPMVLDDILVNFDEGRTESAIETLQEAARRGQQILFFTCHRHLADRFAGKGSKVMNLPDLAAAREERRAG